MDTMPVETLNKDHKGKMMGGVLQDFLPALKMVAKLGSMNNKPFGKYDRGSWQHVKNAELLYLDAYWRHQLEGMYEIDPETGMPHIVAMIWNLMALLCFYLKPTSPPYADLLDASRYFIATQKSKEPIYSITREDLDKYSEEDLVTFIRSTEANRKALDTMLANAEEALAKSIKGTEMSSLRKNLEV